MTQAAEIRRRQSKALADLKTLDRSGLSEIKGLYVEAVRDMTALFNNGSRDGMVRVEKLQQIIAGIDAVLNATHDKANALISDGVLAAAGLGVDEVAVLDAVAVQTSAARAVLGVGADGLSLSQRLWRVNSGIRRSMADEVQRAVISGESAFKAAREMESQGMAPQRDTQSKIAAAGPSALGRVAMSQVVTGDSAAMYKIQRVFRTELARAHTLAYVDSVDGLDDVVGYRFNLSPAHKKRDICDLHARVNLHGLGKGVYPKAVIKRLFPAHPNTTSFVTAVFADELNDNDQRDENRVAWLGKQSSAMQDEVLGKQKGEWLREGKITDRLIGSTVKSLKKRFGE